MILLRIVNVICPRMLIEIALGFKLKLELIKARTHDHNQFLFLWDHLDSVLAYRRNDDARQFTRVACWDVDTHAAIMAHEYFKPGLCSLSFTLFHKFVGQVILPVLAVPRLRRKRLSFRLRLERPDVDHCPLDDTQRGKANDICLIHLYFKDWKYKNAFK